LGELDSLKLTRGEAEMSTARVERVTSLEGRCGGLDYLVKLINERLVEQNYCNLEVARDLI